MKKYIEWMTDKGSSANKTVLDNMSKYVVGARPNFLCPSMIFHIPRRLAPYANWQMIYYQIGEGVDLAVLLSIIAGHLVGYENLFCSEPTYDDLRQGMHKAVSRYDFEETYADLGSWKEKEIIVSYPLRSSNGNPRYLDIKTLPRSQVGKTDFNPYDFNWALGCGPVMAPVPYGVIAFDPTMGPHAEAQQTEAEAEQYTDAHKRYLRLLPKEHDAITEMATARYVGSSMGMISPMKIY